MRLQFFSGLFLTLFFFSGGAFSAESIQDVNEEEGDSPRFDATADSRRGNGFPPGRANQRRDADGEEFAERNPDGPRPGGERPGGERPFDNFELVDGTLDEQLRSVIDLIDLDREPNTPTEIPSIEDPVPQLGKLLFFSTHLGGEEDTACVSCHHPALGGADELSLAVGVHAVDDASLADPELIGIGRHSETAGGTPLVGRNSPTVFNIERNRGMFWDSRVAFIRDGRRGPLAITSPDSEEFNVADELIPEGTTLAAAQARFPVTSEVEMRGGLLPDADNQTVRQELASRFDDSWTDEFLAAFGSEEITFDLIADAIGEYERSMIFNDNPWWAYVNGDETAISDDVKEGALLFYLPGDQGGAGCGGCHRGPLLSDGRHHRVAFPQLSDDTGRKNVTNDEGDIYQFRTPSLLNISSTAPYGHAGVYQTLEEVVLHYNAPREAVDNFFGAIDGVAYVAEAPLCALPQVTSIIEVTGQNCEELFPEAYDFSNLVFASIDEDRARFEEEQEADDNDGADDGRRRGLRRNLDLTINEVAALVAFLESLTDPCVNDRACLDPWIVDSDDLVDYPDDSALVGHDQQKLDL